MPSSTLVACIPHNKTVLIDINNAQAEALWIKKSGTDQGKLILDTNAQLQVYDDSRIDGVVEIGAGAILQFMDDPMTLEGNGGRIQGTGSSASIRGANGGDNGGTMLVLDGDGTSRTSSIMLHGSLIVFTPIDNKSGLVVADNGTLELTYDTDTRASDAENGYWIAERNADADTIGTLLIHVPVNGSGNWQLTSDAGASIIINADCDGNSGPVVIEKGTFRVGDGANVEFVTSGRLDFVSDGGSAPKIIVEAGCYARFNN